MLVLFTTVKLNSAISYITALHWPKLLGNMLHFWENNQQIPNQHNIQRNMFTNRCWSCNIGLIGSYVVLNPDVMWVSEKDLFLGLFQNLVFKVSKFTWE